MQWRIIFISGCTEGFKVSDTEFAVGETLYMEYKKDSKL
jgi:hypothetical protein